MGLFDLFKKHDAKKVLWIVGCLIVLASLGCSGSLSRDKAKSIIQESRDFAPQKIKFVLTAQELQDGATKGYWQYRTIASGFGGTATMFSLTSVGMKVFRLDDEDHQVLAFTGGDISVTTREAIPKKIIEVTGIADGAVGQNGTSKVVEFVWQLDLKTLPTDVSEFLPNP